MEEAKNAIAIVAAEAPPRTRPSNYPEPFASRMKGREKRPLGDLFDLQNFGVNLTRLAPGAQSALRHAHSRQDEFVYVLEGRPTLVTDAGETALEPGKTTLTPSLASYFAASNIPTALMDYDPQGSSINWLRLRGPFAPKIHGANAAPQRTGLRSIGMHVPESVRQLVIDGPAGASG